MIGTGTVRPPTEQVPGVYRRRVGDIVVTALNDGYFDAASIGAGLEVLLNISAEDAQTLLQRAGRPARDPPWARPPGDCRPRLRLRAYIPARLIPCS
jgi:hypothetical protein